MSNAQNMGSSAIPVWVAGILATPKGFQQITALTAAAGLTPPAGATWCMVRCETQNVRWRDDGVAPTATVGMLMLPADAPLLLGAAQMATVKFIQALASAVLDVTYYC